MSDKKQEKVLPIRWGGWDEIDILFFSFYNVTFTDNFGVFKKGDTYSSVSVNYQEGVIEAYNEDGTEVIATQSFNAKPI